MMRCLQPIINHLPVERYGWKKNRGSLVPLWYTCLKLTPKILAQDNNSQNKTTNSNKDEPISEPLNKGTRISAVKESDNSENECDSEASNWEYASEMIKILLK